MVDSNNPLDLLKEELENDDVIIIIIIDPNKSKRNTSSFNNISISNTR